MRGKMPEIAAIILSLCLSGCALTKGQMEPGGITDWVELKGGQKVCGVKLPTDEADKTYCIVISKPSAIVSLDMINRMGH